MSTFKRILCVLLSIALVSGVAALSAGAMRSEASAGVQAAPGNGNWLQSLIGWIQYFLRYLLSTWISIKPPVTQPPTTTRPTTTRSTTTRSTTTRSTTVKVTGVAFSGASSYPLNVGAVQQLSWTVSPSNATDKSVFFVSTKTAVATVSNAGVVTAKGAGTCEIIIKTSDGDFQASVPVVVSGISVTTINISSAGGVSSVAQGKTLQLNAAVLPSNASNKSVIWTSSDTSVATVSSTGLVSAVNKRDNIVRHIKITATAADGQGASRTVDITINVN